MVMIRWIGVFGLVAALVACDGTSSPPTPPAPVSGGPSGETGALTVVPGQVSGCGEESWITSMVTWRIHGNPTARAKVVVADPGAQVSNVFVEGGADGSAKTENWVQSGTRFALFNADTGAELASYTVAGPDCGAAQ